MTIYDTRVVLLMLTLSCVRPSLAKVYTVGDSAGWALNVDYTTWTSDKTFKVGDSLLFNYGSSHTVDEVSSGDYGTCTVGNSIASYTSGPATIALNTTGTHYFICGVVGHCSGGMKLQVPVTGDSSSGKPALTPPTATTTGNVPASSSFISLAPVVLVVGLVSLVFKLVLS